MNLGKFDSHHLSEGERVPLYRKIFTNPIDNYRELFHHARHPIKAVKSLIETKVGEDVIYITKWTYAKAGVASLITELAVEGGEQFGVPFVLYSLGQRELAGGVAATAPFTHYAHFLWPAVAAYVAVRDVKKRKRKALGRVESTKSLCIGPTKNKSERL